MKLSAPVKLSQDHFIDSFSCNDDSIDHYLIKRALRNQNQNLGTTYVTCDGTRVVGYYTISMASIRHLSATTIIKRNAPDPVPMCLMGRLGVDQDYQKQGVGDALVTDFFRRGISISEAVGMKGFLVHALNEKARNFWFKWGLKESPFEELTMMISLKEVKRSID